MLGDIGFQIAEFLEHVDASRSVCRSTSFASRLARTRLYTSCSRLYEELEDWYKSCCPGKALSERGHTYDCLEDAQEVPIHQNAACDFESLAQATNLAYYWCFKLILNDSLSSLMQQASEQGPSRCDRQPNLAFGEFSVAQASTGSLTIELNGERLPTCTQLASGSVALAMSIVLATPYFLRDEVGWLGPQRLWFPMRKAMEYLYKEVSPFASEAQLARSAYEKLSSRLQSC